MLITTRSTRSAQRNSWWGLHYSPVRTEIRRPDKKDGFLLANDDGRDYDIWEEMPCLPVHANYIYQAPKNLHPTKITWSFEHEEWILSAPYVHHWTSVHIGYNWLLFKLVEAILLREVKMVAMQSTLSSTTKSTILVFLDRSSTIMVLNLLVVSTSKSVINSKYRICFYPHITRANSQAKVFSKTI